MEEFIRSEILLGSEKLNTLKNSNIIVFGIGGVGGYVCEMLIRSGIENITIVDFDIVDKSNLNRQIIALHSTIGKNKVDVMQNRLLDINPKLNITKINERVSIQNVNRILTMQKYDYVIDAIDNVTNKIDLIVEAKSLQLNIISAMGAGNRITIPSFEIADIYKTYNDGLAKILRKKLKEKNIEKHNVVFTKNIAAPNGNVVGSISYYPSMCGCVLAGFVINELIK